MSSNDAASAINKSAHPRLGPLTLFGASEWVIYAPYEVPKNVKFLTLTVSVNNPKFGNILVGKIELDTNRLQDLSLNANNRFFMPFVSNGAKFVISSACIYIPHDVGRPSNAGPTSHTENQLKLKGYRDGHTRSRRIGDYFFNQFSSSSHRPDIDRAISYYEHAASLASDSDLDKPGILNSLANALLQRFLRSGNLADIDKAISHHEKAVRLTPDGDDGKPGRLNNLGNSFLTRFQYSETLIDIEKALSNYEQAVRLTPNGHHTKPGRLGNLGNVFLKRFGYSGDLTDVERAISHLEQAVDLTPDSDTGKPDRLSHLGNCFLRRFEHLGDLMDIEKAISCHKRAVGLTPDGHPSKFIYHNDLGSVLSVRFEHSKDLMDIERAISHQERAVRLALDGHVNKPNCLANLGTALMKRFGHSGDSMDVEKAIMYYEQAVHLIPDGQMNKYSCLNNLGSALLKRFQHSGDFIDIDKAISHSESAMNLIPDGHADKPGRMSTLGVLFSRRFDHSGESMDLKRAIHWQEQAVNHTPDDHTAKSGYLSNLGNSFRRRFDQTADLTDINKAISHHEHAVNLTPDGRIDRADCLNNLGTALSRRFRHSRDNGDIEKAIMHQELAEQLIPDSHPNKPGHMNNLGLSFSECFGYSKMPADIDKAISYHECAVNLTPDGHADKPSYLNNLGTAFLRRHAHTKTILYVQQGILSFDPHAIFIDFGNLNSISRSESAIDPTPDDHSGRPSFLENLETSSIHHRRLLRSSADSDLSQAILSFQASAKSAAGQPSVLLDSALQWAHLSRHSASASLLSYETVMALLSRIAWQGQPLPTRYERLASIGSIATEAAAAAIASERPDIALEWLEKGRSIVWQQLLNLRTPIDDLYKVNKGLADNLVSTLRALENATMRGTTPDASVTDFSLEAAAQSHRRLAETLDGLLKNVRMLPGFEDFLLPKKLSTLLQAAETGPVVVINVHKSRSDALVLLSGQDDVLHIPLDDHLYNKAQDMQRSLSSVLQAAGRDARAGRLLRPKSSNNQFIEILGSLWIDVVKPVLDGLAFSAMSTSDLPRIWWCPTGPLTFLPIHAAGIYDQSSHGPNILDFVISSYTPTVTALLEGSGKAPKAFNGLLGVSQSSTPGLTKLPNADKELEHIRKFDSSLHLHSLQGKSATVERVLKGMEEASWVHFACHAVQDPTSALQSAFCLDDGHLTLSKIITKTFPNADFAFLSACETATGDKHLPDEAVHLAAGMLAAGYRSVIATMWSIGDEDAPLIASEVYQRLVNGPTGTDSSMSAHALHQAVKQLRAKVGTDAFLSWVPFIHVGK